MNILVNLKDMRSDLSKTCEIAAPWKPMKFQIYASLYVSRNRIILGSSWSVHTGPAT